MDEQRFVMSHRVTQLRAVAIQVLARRRLALSISADDARLLAAAPSIRQVLARLEARSVLRRAVPGLPRDDAEFQARLAVAEVAATLGGRMDARGRRNLITALVEQEADLRGKEDRLDGLGRAVQDTLAELTRENSEYGKFARYAYRLYSEQRGIIESAVPDGTRRSNALARLDEVFLRHLQKAADHSA